MCRYWASKEHQKMVYKQPQGCITSETDWWVATMPESFALNKALPCLPSAKHVHHGDCPCRNAWGLEELCRLRPFFTGLWGRSGRCETRHSEAKKTNKQGHGMTEQSTVIFLRNLHVCCCDSVNAKGSSAQCPCTSLVNCHLWGIPRVMTAQASWGGVSIGDSIGSCSIGHRGGWGWATTREVASSGRPQQHWFVPTRALR